jgi:ubiquinone/menaquinone biosynthesis C-methylase UbiE
MSILNFDEHESARLDKQYATAAIVEQRRRTLEALSLKPGETVLDIGCGPGYLTAQMAAAVGPSGRVYGIDISAPMLEIARRRCAPFPWIDLRNTRADQLPLPDAAVDATVTVQVYLFADDLAPVLGELERVLRPGGRAVIVDTDWDSAVWHSSDRSRMERFLGVWKHRYTNARVARLFPGALRQAGFTIELAAAIPIVELHCNEGAYSASTIRELPRFVSGKDGVTAAECEAWSQDLLTLSAQGAYFFALNRYLFVARKAR